jgi:hypothetical protein
MKAERIKKAFQVLKDYKKGKAINVACKEHKIGQFGGALRDLGLYDELLKRQPTTQDAIDCLTWLSKSNRKAYLKMKEGEDIGLEAKPYIVGVEHFNKPTAKTSFKDKPKRTYTKRAKNTKKVSIFWGMFKLEW